MILALVSLLAGVVLAQTNEDARALLQEVASSSRAAKSWLAEGIHVGEITGREMNIYTETRFKVAYQGPSKMRSEVATTKETIGGLDARTPSGGLTVCDGVDHWTHNLPSTSFYRNSVTVSVCEPGRGDFSKIAENLVSATLIGRDHVQFTGAARECELVRAEYSIPNVPGNGPDTANFVRTLCIDSVERTVLRDHEERGNASDMLSVETTTYNSYVRDSNLPPELFEFQVPTGYFEDDGPQPDLIVENGVYRMGMQVSTPTLISKLEPMPTTDALQAGVSGIVLVSFQVPPDGNPRKVEVIRGLGHGLDEKAVEAVRQWRFRPGIKDGVPVTVGPLKVAVSFRRP
jgi:TonB family protein